MVPVAVPPTDASICTFLRGALPEEGFAVIATERVLSGGAVQLPPQTFPVSPTLLAHVENVRVHVAGVVFGWHPLAPQEYEVTFLVPDVEQSVAYEHEVSLFAGQVCDLYTA